MIYRWLLSSSHFKKMEETSFRVGQCRDLPFGVIQVIKQANSVLTWLDKSRPMPVPLLYIFILTDLVRRRPLALFQGRGDLLKIVCKLFLQSNSVERSGVCQWWHVGGVRSVSRLLYKVEFLIHQRYKCENHVQTRGSLYTSKRTISIYLMSYISTIYITVSLIENTDQLS